MHLPARLGRDEPDNPLGFRGADGLAGIAAAFGDLIDPELAIRIDHHLDDGRIGERLRDFCAERGLQHLSAALGGFLAPGQSDQVNHGGHLRGWLWKRRNRRRAVDS